MIKCLHCLTAGSYHISAGTHVHKVHPGQLRITVRFAGEATNASPSEPIPALLPESQKGRVELLDSTIPLPAVGGVRLGVWSPSPGGPGQPGDSLVLTQTGLRVPPGPEPGADALLSGAIVKAAPGTTTHCVAGDLYGESLAETVPGVDIHGDDCAAPLPMSALRPASVSGLY